MDRATAYRRNNREAREVSFLQSEEDVNRRLAHGPVHEFRVGGAIAVDLSLLPAGMELFFEGQLSAPMVASCARCAEEFQRAQRASVSFRVGAARRGRRR